MRKPLIFSLLFIFFFISSYATTHTTILQPSAIGKTPVAGRYNVRITLKDSYGNPASGSGLRGFWAKSHQTGEYIYPGGQWDEDKFFDLPAGTYTFGAYEGAWEGAVAKTVTLSQDQVGSDGFIIVTLTYWVE